MVIRVFKLVASAHVATKGFYGSNISLVIVLWSHDWTSGYVSFTVKVLWSIKTIWECYETLNLGFFPCIHLSSRLLPISFFNPGSFFELFTITINYGCHYFFMVDLLPWTGVIVFALPFYSTYLENALFCEHILMVSHYEGPFFNLCFENSSP